MSDPVAVIAENAARLLADAKLLAKNGSYRTAISLAVLSIEESGKACLALWVRDGHLAADEAAALRRGHINKQRIFGTFRTLKAIKSVGEVVRKEDPVLAGYGKLLLRPNPDFLEELSAALLEHAALPKAKAELGMLDHFKQAGFYVDLDEKLDVVEPGVEFDQDWYDMVEEDAIECLEMVRSEGRDHEIMAVLYATSDKLPTAKERQAALDRLAKIVRNGRERR